MKGKKYFALFVFTIIVAVFFIPSCNPCEEIFPEVFDIRGTWDFVMKQDSLGEVIFFGSINSGDVDCGFIKGFYSVQGDVVSLSLCYFTPLEVVFWYFTGTFVNENSMSGTYAYFNEDYCLGGCSGWEWIATKMQ